MGPLPSTRQYGVLAVNPYRYSTDRPDAGPACVAPARPPRCTASTDLGRRRSRSDEDRSRSVPRAQRADMCSGRVRALRATSVDRYAHPARAAAAVPACSRAGASSTGVSIRVSCPVPNKLLSYRQPVGLQACLLRGSGTGRTVRDTSIDRGDSGRRVRRGSHAVNASHIARNRRKTRRRARASERRDFESAQSPGPGTAVRSETARMSLFSVTARAIRAGQLDAYDTWSVLTKACWSPGARRRRLPWMGRQNRRRTP